MSLNSISKIFARSFYKDFGTIQHLKGTSLQIIKGLIFLKAIKKKIPLN